MKHKVSFVNQVIEIIRNFHNDGGCVYFLTLTVKDEKVEGSINKDTISNFLKKLKYRGVSVSGYVWTKELQRRGIVHFHVLVLTSEKLNHDVVAGAWGKGFVFVQRVRVSNDKNFRKIINYLFKYIMKGFENNINNINDNNKMKRKMGRGGILRFRVQSFCQRFSEYSEFQFVGTLASKGFSVKFYRAQNMLLVVACGMRGFSFDILDIETLDFDKIVEKMKYSLPTFHSLTQRMNSMIFQCLTREEIRDIYLYQKYSLNLDYVIYSN